MVNISKIYTDERVAELEFKANLAIAAHWNCATSGTGVAYQGLSTDQNVYDGFRVNVVVSVTEWLMARARKGYTYPRVPFVELALDIYEASVDCGPDETVRSLEKIVRESIAYADSGRYGKHVVEAYEYELSQVGGQKDATAEFFHHWIEIPRAAEAARLAALDADES